MWRRLYFIFPDEVHAVKILTDLQQLGFGQSCVHAIPGKGVTLKQFPGATKRQLGNVLGRIARALWNANLWLFLLAFIGCLVALFTQNTLGVVLTLIGMTATFLSGAYYAIKVPDTSVNEFRGVLAHGEIVLLVDVPRSRVDAVERMICRRHPEAIPGGVTWAFPVSRVKTMRLTQGERRHEQYNLHDRPDQRSGRDRRK